MGSTTTLDFEAPAYQDVTWVNQDDESRLVHDFTQSFSGEPHKGTDGDLQPISSHLGKVVGSRKPRRLWSKQRAFGMVRCNHLLWSRPVTQAVLPSPVYSSSKMFPQDFSGAAQGLCSDG